MSETMKNLIQHVRFHGKKFIFLKELELYAQKTNVEMRCLHLNYIG